MEFLKPKGKVIFIEFTPPSEYAIARAISSKVITPELFDPLISLDENPVISFD